ncbi:MAG: oligopeptide/dipeptide ABC transporter ATP-binding protein [Planctomycetota bacterium]
MSLAEARPLLTVRGLSKSFAVRSGFFGKESGRLLAVDAVDIDLAEGETLGCVGESGCGKTTLGRVILRLLEPDSGSVWFGVESQKDVLAARGAELRSLRRQMQIIFQDPYSSLNPRLKVGSQVGEALVFHRICGRDEVRRRVGELLERVGLDATAAARFPHQFSGGQRQRIGIARALALNPRFVVCDEAVSALDVSIQAQIINLLKDLQQELGLSYLFIAHDLAVVRHISNRVMVMYLGQVVESSRTDELFERPRHPYTRSLLAAVPVRNPGKRGARLLLSGDLPSPMNPPGGCRFHTRCKEVMEICRVAVPPIHPTGTGGWYRCHINDADPERP